MRVHCECPGVILGDKAPCVLCGLENADLSTMTHCGIMGLNGTLVLLQTVTMSLCLSFKLRENQAKLTLWLSSQNNIVKN